MSTPYEPNDRGPQPADPNAPTQFTPVGGPPPQPGFGQQPQQPAGFGQQPQQPAFGQQPQQPAFGQPAAPGGAPAWGQGAPQQPTMPYAYPGNQVPQGKPKRSFIEIFLRSVGGRLVIFAVIAGGVAIYHFATSHPAQRASSGQVSQAGSLQASDLKVGDCFDNPTADSISSVTAIPCTQPHDSQVFAEPAVTESSYPGESTLSAEAEKDCDDSSTQSSVMQDAPEDLKVGDLYAQDADSFDSGNNYVTCFINSSSKNLTASYVSAG